MFRSLSVGLYTLLYLFFFWVILNLIVFSCFVLVPKVQKSKPKWKEILMVVEILFRFNERVLFNYLLWNFVEKVNFCFFFNLSISQIFSFLSIICFSFDYLFFFFLTIFGLSLCFSNNWDLFITYNKGSILKNDLFKIQSFYFLGKNSHSHQSIFSISNQIDHYFFSSFCTINLLSSFPNNFSFSSTTCNFILVWEKNNMIIWPFFKSYLGSEVIPFLFFIKFKIKINFFFFFFVKILIWEKKKSFYWSQSKGFHLAKNMLIQKCASRKFFSKIILIKGEIFIQFLFISLFSFYKKKFKQDMFRFRMLILSE